MHSIINIKKDMLVELCVGKYATFDGLVNRNNGILKTSTTYSEKIIIFIILLMFHNSKIATQTKEKYNHYYDNKIELKWTPIESIIKDMKVGKS
jgi:tetrahydromethanopterin S-methyltransferase subunit E